MTDITQKLPMEITNFMFNVCLAVLEYGQQEGDEKARPKADVAEDILVLASKVAEREGRYDSHVVGRQLLIQMFGETAKH